MSYTSPGNKFIWFMGIVEDINDPEMLGRVKVRILNNEEKDEISTDELLWSWPIVPIHSASLNSEVVEDAVIAPGPKAVGWSPTGLEKNSYVFGFFVDGEEMNIPFIFGSYHKLSLPDKNACPDGVVLHDVSPLARGEQTLFKHPDSSDLQVESLTPLTVSGAGGFIKEPISPYKAKYPFNKTFTTNKGHAIEIDDTPGEERLQVYHRKGTYIEIDKDGQKVSKIVGDDYEIICKDKHVLVKGNLNIEVDQSATIIVKDNAYLWVGGSVSQVVEKNVDQWVKGNVREDVEGDKDVRVKGNLIYGVEGDFVIGVGGNFALATAGKMSLFSEDEQLFHTDSNQFFRVVGDQTTVVDGSSDESYEGDQIVVIGGHHSITTDSQTFTVSSNQNVLISGQKRETASSGQITYDTGSITVTGGIVVASGKNLVTHQHPETSSVTLPPL